MRRLQRWSLLVAVASIALIVVLAGCFSERSATSPTSGTCNVPFDADVAGSTIIAIRDFGFDPGDVTIRAGQKVTWVNCEENAISHTSTSDAGDWDSGLLEPGQAYTQTFDVPGNFPYHCEPHPFMVGRIVVE